MLPRLFLPITFSLNGEIIHFQAYITYLYAVLNTAYITIEMIKNIFLALTLVMLVACSSASDSIPTQETPTSIKAVDLSSYPEIAATNPTFYDASGTANDFLNILKESGVNTVRLRLWVDPVNGHSGFDEVQAFSETLQQQGFKIWLTLHYSDTWADPGTQETPAAWQGLDVAALEDQVYQYTANVVATIQPDYIQIGNEINSGMLHPYGAIDTQAEQFVSLLQSGATAVRATNPNCKIILHYAGIEGADWFFNEVQGVPYDIIGLSYYPIWHGKSLTALQTSLQNLSETYDKEVVIAETAYPFTLDWNDWTNNIVGEASQLILPEYPATPEGQYQFIHEIQTLTQTVPNGIGFCYWGAELIAWKGNEATDASSWENQALFDFNHKALPVLDVFGEE